MLRTSSSGHVLRRTMFHFCPWRNSSTDKNRCGVIDEVIADFKDRRRRQPMTTDLLAESAPTGGFYFQGWLAGSRLSINLYRRGKEQEKPEDHETTTPIRRGLSLVRLVPSRRRLADIYAAGSSIYHNAGHRLGVPLSTVIPRKLSRSAGERIFTSPPPSRQTGHSVSCGPISQPQVGHLIVHPSRQDMNRE
jgi:hypothetical protein